MIWVIMGYSHTQQGTHTPLPPKEQPQPPRPTHSAHSWHCDHTAHRTAHPATPPTGRGLRGWKTITPLQTAQTPPPATHTHSNGVRMSYTSYKNQCPGPDPDGCPPGDRDLPPMTGVVVVLV